MKNVKILGIWRAHFFGYCSSIRESSNLGRLEKVVPVDRKSRERERQKKNTV